MRTMTLIWLVALMAVGCKKADEPEHAPQFGPKPPSGEAPRPEYLFAVHPLHNPTRLFEVYQPLVDLINAQTTEFSVKLEASLNYAAFEDKLYHRRLHFALPNPLQTIEAEKHGYRIFGKMGDDDQFTGIILVRKDSGINQINDLKGAAISFPAPTAVAACMMPKLYLKQRGLDVDHDCEPRYVGSQESSIMNVYRGETKAGVTWPPPWESFARQHPEMARALVVKWETEPLLNNGLVVRDDVPAAHLKIVADVFFNLHKSEAGRQILARMNLSRFEPADSATYEPMRRFLTNYEEAFPPAPMRKETP